MTAVIRFSRNGSPRWVLSASFADGDGYRVRRVSTTPDRDRAAAFPVAVAHAIAAQFYHLRAALETPDGAPLADATVALRAEQTDRSKAAAARDDEFDKAVRETFPADLLALIRKAVR